MSDVERIMALRQLASKLGIRLHVVSTNLDNEPLSTTHVEHLLGVDVISNTVSHRSYPQHLYKEPET